MVTQVAATAPGAVALHSSGTEALTSCDPRGFLRSRHKADNEQPKEEHVCLWQDKRMKKERDEALHVKFHFDSSSRNAPETYL